MFRIIQIISMVILMLMSHIFIANAETIKVKLETAMGDIHIDLYGDKAPVTVTNFLKYIDAGHFNGGSFYRVVRMNNQQQNKIKIQVIQGGMSGDSDIGLFDPIILERTNMTNIKHLDGVISMARDKPNSASSEFFICINDQPDLDFGGLRNPDGQGFAAFGRVTAGMDVVRKIQNATTQTPKGELRFTSGQSLINPVLIKSLNRE